MKQAIEDFRVACTTCADCERQIREAWAEYEQVTGDDKKAIKRRSHLLKQRKASITRVCNLYQKQNAARTRMIEAILQEPNK